MLYADDTIILVESKHDLQAALSGMYHYCNIWKVQLQKTKVVIFGKKKSIPNTTYSFGRAIIGVVDEYTYLGILFKSNGSLKPCLVQLRNIACKAMYSLLKKSKRLGLDIDIQMHLFDSVVMPIALYGCEVFFKNIDLLEKLHLLFCKMILKVKKALPLVWPWENWGDSLFNTM